MQLSAVFSVVNTSTASTAIDRGRIHTMKQLVILLAGFSCLIPIAFGVEQMAHLASVDTQPKNNTPMPAFEPSDRGHPDVSFGSATR
jgi:hypothetical protein